MNQPEQKLVETFPQLIEGLSLFFGMDSMRLNAKEQMLRDHCFSYLMTLNPDQPDEEAPDGRIDESDGSKSDAPSGG